MMLWRLPEFAPFLAVYALWVPIWVYLANGLTAAFSFEGFKRQPLNDFYYIYWPTSLAFLLVLHEPWLLPLLALVLLWELPAGIDERAPRCPGNGDLLALARDPTGARVL
jgi:hypothetical protein